MDTGDYFLLIVIDSPDVIESGKSNNNGVTGATVHVDKGEVDLAGEFGQITLPPAVILGETVTGKVLVDISNDGNLNVDQMVDIQIIASPNGDIDNPDNVTLAMLDDQALKLKPGASKTFNVTLPDTLPENDCFILIRVDSLDGPVEAD